MNHVVVSTDVVKVLAKLADRDDPAGRAIRVSIGMMGIRSPQDPKFPGYLGRIGPVIAVRADGYRIEIIEITVDDAMRHPELRVGSIYVYALVSPDEQANEPYTFG